SSRTVRHNPRNPVRPVWRHSRRGRAGSRVGPPLAAGVAPAWGWWLAPVRKPAGELPAAGVFPETQSGVCSCPPQTVLARVPGRCRRYSPGPPLGEFRRLRSPPAAHAGADLTRVAIRIDARGKGRRSRGSALYSGPPTKPVTGNNRGTRVEQKGHDTHASFVRVVGCHTRLPLGLCSLRRPSSGHTREA